MNRSLLAVVLLLALSSDTLLPQWEKIAVAAQGKVGVAAKVVETGESAELNGGAHFPMQSVCKFPIAMDVLEQVDRGILRLDQKVMVRGSDLVPVRVHSPLRDQHPRGNVPVTIRELLRLMVSESDGTASDVLLRVLGGPEHVTTYLHNLGMSGIVIATSEKEMAQAQDVQYRNWTTPAAMAELLIAFQQGKGLSAASRTLLLQWMAETETGLHRLKGLLPPGTVVAHKTGTSGTVGGLTAATNDVGLITLPDGRHLAIAVFVSDAQASEQVRERIIAQIAKASWNHWVQ